MIQVADLKLQKACVQIMVPSLSIWETLQSLNVVDLASSSLIWSTKRYCLTSLL